VPPSREVPLVKAKLWAALTSFWARWVCKPRCPSNATHTSRRSLHHSSTWVDPDTTFSSTAATTPQGTCTLEGAGGGGYGRGRKGGEFEQA